MDEQKHDDQQTAPTRMVAERKSYTTPLFIMYGSVRQITAMVATNGNKDGASGVMNVRTKA